MTTLMFLLAATLLVICLLEFSAILGLRQMVEDVEGTFDAARKSLDNYKLRHEHMAERAAANTAALEAAAQRLDESRDEVKRISCELEVCKLSLRNAQNQFAEQVEANNRLRDNRHEFREMLVSIAEVLIDQGELLDQVQKGTVCQDGQHVADGC